ncbi:MAG: esterase/lipase family protein, partial [Burkholderiaceae bacterium]
MIRRLLLAVAVVSLLLAALFAAWLRQRFGWPWIAAGLVGLSTPLLLHGAILAAQFTVSAAFRRAGGLHYPAGLAMRAWLGELRASLRTFVLAQLRDAGRPLPSGAGDERMAVLLVHGYVCNHAIWRPFADWLSRRGHRIEGVDLEPLFGSIDDYVAQLEQAVARLQARNGGRPIAIVAHSMGGLAARAYLARGAGADDTVAALITLGSPHRGTWSAQFAHGRNVAQMRPDSRWLAALSLAEDEAQRERFTIILSHHDNIIVPQATQTLAGARTHALIGRGHVQLAYDEEAWSLAAQAIDAAQARLAA